MSKKKDDFIGCSVKSLPEDQILEAANTARIMNPANAPLIQRSQFKGDEAEQAFDAIMTPMRIALLHSKYWGTQGVHLPVGFMERPQKALIDKVLHYMNRWGEKANTVFAYTQSLSEAKVRISFSRGGYWSYLGTDILHIPKNQQTMNLEGFTLRTPESEYERVVCHETGHCLVGDTLIDCPRDLEKYPKGIPIRDLVGQQPHVYAWKDGQIVIRKASRVWLSKKQVPIIRVTLRTGQGIKNPYYLPPLELKGTADHPILLADGKTYKNLGDLQSGDRLCSLYRSKAGDRSEIRWTGSDDRLMEHVFVCQQVYGDRPFKHDAHHKNERKLDQSPDNLEWKDEFLHHSEHRFGKKDSEETRQRKKVAQANREYRHSPAMCALLSRLQRERFATVGVSDETRAKLSVAAKDKRQSPQAIANRNAALRRFYDNGGRSGMFGKTASEETRAKRSASMKATLARKRMAGVSNHIVVSVEQVGVSDVYDMTVPGADNFIANGVVVHNSLGAPHEHMRSALVALLDTQRTIAYFRQTQGWSPEEIRQQVLTPLNEMSLFTTPADQDSIMCYQIPGQCTKDGKPIHGGMRINESDFTFMAKMYPKSVSGGGGSNVLLAPPEAGTEVSTKTGVKHRLIVESDSPMTLASWE